MVGALRYAAHSQPQRTVERLQRFSVSRHQIVVGSDDMHRNACEPSRADGDAPPEQRPLVEWAMRAGPERRRRMFVEQLERLREHDVAVRVERANFLAVIDDDRFASP